MMTIQSVGKLLLIVSAGTDGARYMNGKFGNCRERKKSSASSASSLETLRIVFTSCSIEPGVAPVDPALDDDKAVVLEPGEVV